jgi:hypothetical protein
VQIPVYLEDKQAWVSGNHAYEPLLSNFSALFTFGQTRAQMTPLIPGGEE